MVIQKSPASKASEAQTSPNGKAPNPPGGYKHRHIPWGWIAAGTVAVLILGNVIEAKLKSAPTLPEGLIQANGRIEGDHVIVSSKFAGRLNFLGAREGDTVTRDEVLLRVEDPQTLAKRDQAAADLSSALAQAAGSSGSVDLTRETGAAVVLQARGQLDQAESAIGSARSDFLRSQAAVDYAMVGQEQADLNVPVAQSTLAAARANRARATSALKSASAALSSARATLLASQETAESAHAASLQADREAARSTALGNEGAIPVESAERARTAATQAAAAWRSASHQVDAAQASVDARQTDVDSATQGITVADAAVREATAQLAMAKRQVAGAAATVRQARAQRSGYAQGVKESEARQRQAVGQLHQAMTAPTQVRVSERNQQSAEARIKQARGALNEIQSMIDEMSVKSPTSGTVITRFQDRGEMVSPGSPILEVVDLDRLYLKVYVTEDMIGKLRLGLPALIYTDAYPNQPFTAKVGYISSEAEFTPKDVQTSSERVTLVYAVRLYLDANPNHRLTPGLPADAIIKWKDGTPWQKPH